MFQYLKDFLTRLGVWFAVMDRYFFPICVHLASFLFLSYDGVFMNFYASLFL